MGTIADLTIHYRDPAAWGPDQIPGDRALSHPSRTAGIATQLLVVLAVVSVVFAALSAVVVAAVA